MLLGFSSCGDIISIKDFYRHNLCDVGDGKGDKGAVKNGILEFQAKSFRSNQIRPIFKKWLPGVAH